MPNHVTTTFTIEGPAEDLARFRATHVIVVEKKGESDIFLDFRTVIPMPAILDGIVSGSRTDLAVQYITGKRLHEITNNETVAKIAAMFPPLPAEEMERRYSGLTTEDLAMGARALQAIEETGHPTWYEWCLASWGTKWNSYNFSIVDDGPTRFVCRFDTAWSTPTPVLTKLAELYPALQFTSHSYDEGGYFEAHGQGLRGQFVERTQDPTDVGYELAYGRPPDRDDDDEAEQVDAASRSGEA